MQELDLKDERRKTLIVIACLSGMGLLMGVAAIAGVAAYVYL